MAISASKLRENIYQILDEILQTGEAVEIERKGQRLRIVKVDEPTRSRLDALPERPGFLLCDPDEIVHVDWSGEWQP